MKKNSREILNKDTECGIEEHLLRLDRARKGIEFLSALPRYPQGIEQNIAGILECIGREMGREIAGINIKVGLS